MDRSQATKTPFMRCGIRLKILRINPNEELLMIPQNMTFRPFKMRSLAAAGLLAASGAASAVPVQSDMYFQCTYPLIGQQPLTADIATDMPESIGVGEATGAFTPVSYTHLTLPTTCRV